MCFWGFPALIQARSGLYCFPEDPDVADRSDREGKTLILFLQFEMKIDHTKQVAQSLGLREGQVEAVAGLLAGGATVPFIARYRKEATGELDEVQIAAVRDNLAKLAELDARRAAILESLKERNLLTDDLSEKIALAETMSALEDLYLPYRPKRRTRAMVARERGLEPLALALFAQESAEDAETVAAAYVDPAQEVPDVEAALAGARDIIAEKVNEDADARAEIRDFFASAATITATVVEGKEEEGAKFRDYFGCCDPLATIAGHRLLAMFRGEKEGFLTLTVRPSRDEAILILKRRFVKGESSFSSQVAQAVESAYNRLMAPSMEVETRMEAFRQAGEEAIGVFSANLRELLMAPPLGRKAVLAIDPGIRTGCKVVCLDPQGKLLFDTVIQLAQSDALRREAAGKIVALCQKFSIQAIAIGNGTYGRETMDFVRSLQLPPGIVVTFVNESGASIYSASDVAREEFPDKDVTVRGSVSIGRRLMDPLAELVKLDPKSIGVGQYQHDVDQQRLKQGLDEVVMSCVNSVGVEVNTASKQLLAYVSGLGPSLAENIVRYRDEHGPFASRADLRSVPRLGPKAFEQCAGFLRISGAANPLDSSAVHPERYPVVEKMAADLGCSVADLVREPSRLQKLDISAYVSQDLGLPTLRDIVAELAKPGRDPRQAFEAFSFAESVSKLDDLTPGMKLPGVVTNVTNFGAFVDIGVHQDGLVHISELSDHFVSDPNTVVKVGQKVEVTVKEVDLQRRRIALTLKRGVPRTAPGAQGGAARDSRGARDNRDRRDPRDARRGATGRAAPSNGGLNSAFSDALSKLLG